MTPHILILAAGASSRMRGGDKLMQLVAGIPLVRHSACRALATGLPVAITLPPDRPMRHAAVADLPLSRVIVQNAVAGIAESLTTGLAALPPDAPVLMLLADLPDLTTDDLLACLAIWEGDAKAIPRGAAEDGSPGHPVGFPADLRAELRTLSGDQGARRVLAQHAARVRLVPLPGTHATTDLDTPEDWAQWRAARASD